MSIKFRALSEVPTGLKPGLVSFLQGVKEDLEILIGRRKRGEVKSRAVLFQDLIDLGLITEEDLPDD